MNARRKRINIPEIQTAQGDMISTSENIGAEAVLFLKNSSAKRLVKPIIALWM